MCAIIDANVASKAFGRDKRTEDGDLFREWVDKGQGRLVVGGKVKRELVERVGGFKHWLKEAESSNRVKLIDDGEVERRTTALSKDSSLRSNDQHVIALAQISGARLLYSNDEDLKQDFGDKHLIDKPRGKVYSGLETRHLLKRKDLCKSAD